MHFSCIPKQARQKKLLPPAEGDCLASSITIACLKISQAQRAIKHPSLYKVKTGATGLILALPERHNFISGFLEQNFWRRFPHIMFSQQLPFATAAGRSLVQLATSAALVPGTPGVVLGHVLFFNTSVLEQKLVSMFQGFSIVGLQDPSLPAFQLVQQVKSTLWYRIYCVSEKFPGNKLLPLLVLLECEQVRAAKAREGGNAVIT